MATAADVRSIFSIQAPSTPGPSQPKKPPTTVRKPDGISRELYSLIGPSAPSLAAQLAKPRLKQKPNLGGSGKVKWEWRPFKNSARSDGLVLRHWVRANTDPDAEYPFAKYSVQPASYTYSEDEYTHFLEDKEWSKEETDCLFRLANDYDLRWFIIQDRYEHPDGTARTVEDLKDRYYSVCRKLVRNRPWTGDEQSKQQLLSSLQFDKEREITRKKYISSLENRTPEQIAEEEALFVEVKRLEQNERRFRRDRDDLLRTLSGVESGLADLAVDDEALNLASLNANGMVPGIDTKRKRRGYYDEGPSTPSTASAIAPIIKRPQSAKSAAYDLQHCITRFETPAAPVPATKAAHQSAHLRSFKIPMPKSSIAPKVTQALTEVGVQHTRLVMPTRENITHLETLIDATCAMIEAKKLVDKIETDIRILRARIDSRLNPPAEKEADGDATKEGDAAAGNAMDVDAEDNGDRDAEGEPDEEEKAPSVVSARNGRRKQSQRSMSVSSVETSATRGTKRQKRG